MKERPIIFNADMVRAVLDGRKTQTRRIIKLDHERGMENPVVRGKGGAVSYVGCRLASTLCPFGEVGDRLWVRETFRVHSRATDVATLVYKASEQQSWTQQTHRVPIEKCNKPAVIDKWTPSIHMPRWASRVALEITGVRLERLKDISAEDVTAEGIKTLGEAMWGPQWWADAPQAAINDAQLQFSIIWSKIYGEASWQANPWVWVIEFQHVGGE
ncbi:hypothetical protein [Erwinia sp. QL-Z3]|uniref:hypothetical protein n=1 Tax=Erwinia sp. QL-Z3 TaxID=2547962 RepID=UPI0010715BB7|nr:hypothetical protein [Erwinia sp. QL-Z3]QBR52694.1 hypothetical protein E2F51_23205 [Erwinia sp. QL-Z3]